MPLVDMQFVEYVNDPIWGEIPLTRIEWDIINSPIFRRLQHVRQMGLAYLAFPTANHRRFEHCIGAMHVAYLLSEILADLAPSDMGISLDRSHFQAVRLAALLHDIGHAPYSHAFEEAARRHPEICTIRPKPRRGLQKTKSLQPLIESPEHYSHELFTKFTIESNADLLQLIGGWIQRVGGFPSTQIAALSVGEATHEGLSLFNPVVSGDFDADRIDYVCRDSYYCGFNQRFNFSELRRNLILRRSNSSPHMQILLKDESIPAISTLLWYRYRLMRTVHLNRANRIATQLFVEALRTAFSNYNADKMKPAIGEEKMQLLIRFHTEMTDEDCTGFLIKYGGDAGQRFAQASKGATLPEEVYTLNRKLLTADERLFIHFILMEPPQVGVFQERVQGRLDSGVLADIRVAKAPKLATLVKDTSGDDARSIFDNYYTPHGIMIDSMNTMALFLYHPHRPRYQESVDALAKISVSVDGAIKHMTDPLRRVIYKCLEETYRGLKTGWAAKKRVFSLEFLLTLIGCIEEAAWEMYRQRLWCAGDGRLQSFIRHVLTDIAGRLSVVPKYTWTDNAYSVDVFVGLEILSMCGMVDHIHTPIGGSEDNRPWMGSRIDRRITTFGRRYFDKWLISSYEHTIVQEVVTRRMRSAHNEHRRVLDLESELAEMKLVDERRDLAYSQLNDLRNTISHDRKCVVLSTRAR